MINAGQVRGGLLQMKDEEFSDDEVPWAQRLQLKSNTAAAPAAAASGDSQPVKVTVCVVCLSTLSISSVLTVRYNHVDH